MSNILKLAKYQMFDFSKAVVTYYAVVLIISSLVIVTIPTEHISGNAGFAGVTLGFVFIASLNCFKNQFKFMQANNVSRKSFYLGTIIALVGLVLVMTIVDLAINYFLNRHVIYSLFQQVYGSKAIFTDLVWSFALLLFAASLGWFITMLYYRCNTPMKILVSLSPVLLSTLITYLSRLTNRALGRDILMFVADALGFSQHTGPNPLMAAFSFTVGTVGLLALNYLLIKKAPIKD